MTPPQKNKTQPGKILRIDPHTVNFSGRMYAYVGELKANLELALHHEIEIIAEYIEEQIQPGAFFRKITSIINPDKKD